KKFGLPREGLIFNVSHTHCAPEVAAERLVFHALPPAEEAKLAAYIDDLKTKLVDLIGEALLDMKPADLTWSKSAATFGRNRRFPTAAGFVNQQHDAGVSDRDVPVLRVTNAVGGLVGVLFGYACHNTTLAFQQYCGDYAGFAHQQVEQRHPGAVALFVMGCGGDQNPYPRHGPDGLKHAERHGRELADAVDEALKAPGTPVRGALKLAYSVETLALEPAPTDAVLREWSTGPEGPRRRKAMYLKEQLRKNGKIDETQRCPLHVARFGDDLLFVAVSGETVVDYSLICKKEFADKTKIVWTAGYNDDVFAYLPSRRVLLEGGYEGRDGIVHQLTPAPFTDAVEDVVMGGLRKLVAETAKN
ncbi:MAG: neutral/alkaline non-lysosomal ceramidase N-terminal domain-containing protein, partial [Planctomycetia bacterium]